MHRKQSGVTFPRPSIKKEKKGTVSIIVAKRRVDMRLHCVVCATDFSSCICGHNAQANGNPNRGDSPSIESRNRVIPHPLKGRHQHHLENATACWRTTTADRRTTTTTKYTSTSTSTSASTSTYVQDVIKGPKRDRYLAMLVLDERGGLRILNMAPAGVEAAVPPETCPQFCLRIDVDRCGCCQAL